MHNYSVLYCDPLNTVLTVGMYREKGNKECIRGRVAYTQVPILCSLPLFRSLKNNEKNIIGGGLTKKKIINLKIKGSINKQDQEGLAAGLKDEGRFLGAGQEPAADVTQRLVCVARSCCHVVRMCSWSCIVRHSPKQNKYQ